MINLLNCIYDLAASRKDLGLFIFRVVLGTAFICHGYPKISGGIAAWTGLGKTMAVFGITFAPAMWGFFSAAAEFFGGILIVLGLFYRPAALLLFFDLMVAFGSEMMQGRSLFKSSQSIEDGFSYFAAIFIGPGKYSLDYYLKLDRHI